MGRASRKKRERREELPEKFDFGPEFVVRAGLATAHASVDTGSDTEPEEG
jgi:hypothetical protein